MNFLQLAKRTRQECGISGDGPASVEGQVGIYAKLVDWVRTSYEDVQQAHNDWRFDWASADVNLTDGVEAYSPLGLWALRIKGLCQDGLFVYRADQGPRVKYWLAELPWEEYRQLRMGDVRGQPAYVSQAPDERLHFFPVPTAGLKLRLEYYQLPALLEKNLDVPRMPERYHMAIVWRAVMLWCAHDENVGLYNTAAANYRAILQKMQVSELPGMRSSETLA